MILSALTLGAIFVWGGAAAFATAVLLSILEITLSFDNAVVNAKVLTRMNEVWQKRFLTWGIFAAVFLTRLVLPILIVSASVLLAPLVVAQLALFDSVRYVHLLEDARYLIGAFGGSFLLMVSLKYFFDDAKDVHWIDVIEKHLARWGRIEAIEIALALIALLGISFAVPEHRADILAAGIIGVTLFIIMQGLASSFSIEADKAVAGGSFALFVYLNILDSAFSLDGVVGAFAITKNLPVIVAGLGIGAYFVRTITVYLVRKKTLSTLRYLEHGAHWAIFGLAASMLLGLFMHIPESVTGLIGLIFAIAAYYSSLRHMQK